MKCFKCSEDFSDRALIVHLKTFHSLDAYSTYQCCESVCYQHFGNLKSFRKHIKKHKIGILLDSNQKTDSSFDSITNTMSPTISNIVLSENPISASNKNKSDCSSNQEVVDFSEGIQNIEKSIIKFCLQLHDNNNFNRKNIEDIQEYVVRFITTPIAQYIESVLKVHKVDFDVNYALGRTIAILKDVFKPCKTEYLLNNWLMANNLVPPIEQFSINDEINLITRNGEAVYDDISTKGVLLSMHFQMKTIGEKYFDIDSIVAINKQTSASKSYISDFCEGAVWKKKLEKFHNKLCIPYFLYFDGFEINNPLGSHSDSITGVYFSFPFFKNISKTENIFIAGFIKSHYFKEFGNEGCLKNLIESIKSLENDGVKLFLAGNLVHVHFVLGLIVGDNLGVHEVCDFTKSFSANYFCRFCKYHKSETRYLCKNDGLFDRNVQNYEIDASLKILKETGVQKKSIFNTITSFHVIENYFVDIMHDIFEGICHYDLCHVIIFYTEKAKIFSLDMLNNRKQNFNYGPIDIGNLSPEILVSDLKRGKLKMTASEMKCFVHYFPLMIGDLIPINDEVWEFVVTLIQIIDTLLSRRFNKEKLLILEELIQQHHIKYLKYFNDTLKPKHHFLLHYPKVIEYSGPPRDYWCYGFESKHKLSKQYARATNSRRNICLSLAKKAQLKFSQFCITSASCNIICHPKYLTKTARNVNFRSKLKQSENDFDCYSQIIYKGTIYKKGLFLTKYEQDLELFEVIEIFVRKHEEFVVILVDQINVSKIDSHFQAFEINGIKTIVQDNLLVYINEFSGPPINLTKTPTGKLMIRLKEYF